VGDADSGTDDEIEEVSDVIEDLNDDGEADSGTVRVDLRIGNLLRIGGHLIFKRFVLTVVRSLSLSLSLSLSFLHISI
jgi:hypothetical protein